MQFGGSTKPWLVTAIQQESATLEEIPYVAKLFSDNNVVQGHSIGKEFFCNELAGQFDFDVAEAALINLNDESFKATLDESTLDILNSKYKGNTFASKLAEASLVNEQLKDTSFNIHDCASLFAFDCMILNVDRGGERNNQTYF